jgi:hypothetical protein
LVLACMALIYWRHNRDEIPLTARHRIVMVAAIWSAIWEFTMQHRIVRARRSRRSRQSTPFTRWRAGHIARLCSATSLGLSAVVLGDWGGPHLIVNALLRLD